MSTRTPAPRTAAPSPAPGPGGRTAAPIEQHLSEAPVPQRNLGLLLTVGGVIGFIASFVLTVERIKLAEDPNYTPSCSLNPVISCGSVMASDRSHLFGFPNPLLGIGAFAVAVTLGALLLSGVAVPRWMRAGFQVGITLGMAFVLWLAYSSLYHVHALCPYCMVVWATVIPLFWTTTVDNLDRGVLPVPAGARRAVAALVDYRILLTVATYALFVLLIGIQFWSYWKTLV